MNRLKRDEEETYESEVWRDRMGAILRVGVGMEVR